MAPGDLTTLFEKKRYPEGRRRFSARRESGVQKRKGRDRRAGPSQASWKLIVIS